MDYSKTPYFHVAHARDLTGRDRIIFRLLEILPGLLSWGTLILIVVGSVFFPMPVAVFIIIFDLYWLLKTVHLSFHQYYNWRRLKYNISVDWQAKLADLKYEHLRHVILLPFYKEGKDVIEASIKSLLASHYDPKKMIVVLAAEVRAGSEYTSVTVELQKTYAQYFDDFIVTMHPDNLPGEVRGKGSNIAYALKETQVRVIDSKKIPYENILVSSFDIDTVIWPHYFACLTWNFLTTENRYNKSYQPVPLYNNNIWQAPALSRVAAVTSTFWQMIQQERPEKLATFSSHSIPFKALYEVGYWQKNMVSEDSRIFWNLFLAKDGNYEVVPLAYPVSMDANLAPTLFATLRNIYKQHMRWMWGVENIPYMLFGFIKNKKISWKQKWDKSFTQLVGFWSLATNPIMILVLGWLPIIVGGEAFRETLLSYNLPIVTRTLMTISTLGIILAAIISASLLPAMPVNMERRKIRWAVQILQWVFVPFTIILFGSLPGLHAQTKLMFGRYMGEFWVTPKHRK